MKTQRVSQLFPDVYSLGQAVDFDIGFRQLSSGSPAVPGTALISENVTLTHMSFGCSYHQLGLPPANQLTLGVPIGGLRNWFGRRYRRTSILPFNHPDGIDGVSERGFEAATVTFSIDFLADTASAFQISVPDWLRDPAPDSVIEAGKFNNDFRNLLNLLFFDPDSELGQELEDELIVTLLYAAKNGAEVGDRSSPATRARALEKALAYIADHNDEAVSVRNICSENDIALRTLNRSFHERFGIGPKAYLKMQKLSAVRRDLLRSPAGTLVTDIANRWGFWHMGQFARDYREHFNELPSETIRS